jgi:hypothetical protein
MSGDDEEDEVELFLERVLAACNAIDARLDQVESELTPSPASLSDNATSGAVPVVGAQGAAELEQALNDGWRC